MAVDADRGRMTMAYDPNGALTIQTDPRGSADTVYIGYDGLNRVIWRNTSNTPSGAYVTETYDQSGHGNGIGRLTTESYTNGGGGSSVSLNGSHSYTYDARGQITSQTDSVTGHPFTFGMAYNDAGQQTSLTYSDNEVMASNYNTYGWLTSLTTTPSGQGATTLLSNITYSGVGGAAGKPTGASVGGSVYTYSASYDDNLRLTSESLTNASTHATLYSVSRGYDAVSNVTSVATTVTAGTDNQVFCYDALDRLTWAGATGTPSCGGSITAGTLTAATYTQTFSYDPIGRLKSLSTNGNYTYGDSNHPHAVTAIGSVYQASYDAAGEMTCRAPGSGVTCTGSSPNGQTMTYDAERRLAHWQNTPGSPATQDDFLYDGGGQLAMQYVNVNGVITTTAYLLGGVEESTGGVITKYLGVAGLPQAVRVGSTLSYLTGDGLNSVSDAFNTTGAETATQLFAPYGTTRYAANNMPTSRGFTGQQTDVTMGMDYYVARYYDPQAGQFISADSMSVDLSPYSYVSGNPETFDDPSGHCPWCIVGAIIGAVVGAGIAYGTQVYNNYQNGQTGWNAWTSNINWGAVAGGALIGAFIGGTLGIGAGVFAGAISAGAGITTAGLLATAAISDFVGYGITPWGGDNAVTNDATTVSTEANAAANSANVDTEIPTTVGVETPTGDTNEPPQGNPLANPRYDPRIYDQQRGPGEFHSFPDTVENYGADGVITEEPGGDGIVRTHVRIYGTYSTRGNQMSTPQSRTYDGFFHFIVEPDGTIRHRFFTPIGPPLGR